MTVHMAEPEKQALDPKTRQALIRLLSGIPGVVEAVRTASAGQTFRAVMSEKNAHLLKQAADGYFKPCLRETGQFVEIVNLEAVAPSYARSIADLSLSVTLAVIVVKLDAIQAGIGEIKRTSADVVRGETLGALDALASATAMTDPAERRHHRLARCLDVEAALGKLAGQLRSHVRAMPSQETPWYSGLFGNGIAEATAAYDEVEQDMAVFTKGLRELMQSLHELDELEMAKVWIHRIGARLEEVALPDAIARARLLPMPTKGLGPEQRLAAFLPIVTDLNSQALGVSVAPLTIEFDPMELQA